MKPENQSLQNRVLRIGCAVYGAFVVVVGLVLLYLHTQAVEQGKVHAESHAEIMAEQTARFFDATDQRLQLAQIRLAQLTDLNTLDTPSALAVFQGALKDQPYLLDMWLLDRSGRIVYDTHPGTVGVSLADRAFYTTHLAQADTSFFIDAPVLSRRTGKFQISVSRAWRSADGALLGVVVASMDPAHFENIWRDVSLTPQDTATLFTADGVMLMRSPFAASVGENFKHRPLFTQHLPHATRGTFLDHSPVDSVRRILSYQTLDKKTGLVLMVGLSYDAQLNGWTQLAWMVLLVVLVMAVAFVWLARSLLKAWERNRLAHQKAQLSDHALQAISQGVLIAGADRKTLSVNAAFEALTGYAEHELLGRSCKLLQGPLADAGVAQAIRKALNAGKPFNGEILNYRKDGTTFWNALSISPVFDAQGSLTHFVGLQQDITQHKARQIQLRLTEQVFNQARESIVITDAQANIIRVNGAFTVLSGYSEAEVLGKNPRVFSSGLQNAAFYQTMWAAIVDHGVWSGEIYNRHKDGTVYPQWLTVSAIRDDQGAVTHYLGSSSDLRQIKAAESQLKALMHFDTLTGLPNRTLLQDRTAHAISTAQRAKESVCMMLVSLDHFKLVNDTLGHKVGDGVLIEVAQRLGEALREQDTVSHHAGNAFTIILPNTRADGAAHVASELLWKLAQPYGGDEYKIPMTACIGLSVYPDNGNDFDALYKAAEIALHRVQALGRDNFQFYTEGMYNEVIARDTMSKALRLAVERDELQVLYQPLVDLQTGHISGMEALLRWHHPELGTVSPVVFIPLAEETGLIRSIGEWVLRRVCADQRAWLDQGLDTPHVAVNVSPVQFRDPAFVQTVALALSDHGVASSRIHLEVTESALMADAQRCEEILHTLKKMGLCLSLDDFGTGYSSLSYLKRYPFDKVKIDQSFVRDIGSSEADLVIVKVIISMAHGLGLKVIAEGVETEEQCEIMRANVCDEIQGFLFSRPVDADTMQGMLQSAKQLPAHLLRFRAKQRTLLLVDDEPNILTSLKRLFRRDGYTIVTAESGAEGLAALAAQKVDVIISDQRMPGMTGVEFLREAKALYPDTVRIVLSGYTELQSVTDAINEGAVYRFLTKPWEDAQLREHISKAFEYKELQEENQQLDIQIRTTNQELVATNRQLGDVIDSTRKQIETDSISLAIVREALQLIPTPVLGLDDEQVVIFANAAAEALLGGKRPLLGVELVYVSPALFDMMRSTQAGHMAQVQIDGNAFDVRWNAMGQHSRSRGTLMTMIPSVSLC